MPQDGVECDFFPIISIDSLLVYESKYYPQVYLYSCAFKIIEKQMMAYLDENLYETDEHQLFDSDKLVL